MPTVTPTGADGATALVASATPSPTLRPTATGELETVTFTIVYDNNAYDAGLRTSWGFSCWVETDKVTVLFDTGGDGPTLMHNLREFGLDPKEIDVVVLSHAHGDHTGGLGTLLGTGVRPTVYAPASFPGAFKTDVGARTELVEVREATTIAPGIVSTGEVGSTIVEQALAVETQEGLVVVTGCAHPGIVQMVRRAKETTGGEIALVMGGFHLGGASPGQIEQIIADFRGLGVKRIAPCHCTGDKARHAFVDAFGEDAVLAGVGWSTELLTIR
jgi:7,8-dihydropterin-6-yl-methyl-4-(beta-D-ribofuranosyl)aminobenzene 5'-phosphate synthase